MDTGHPYWLRQEQGKPLFPELEWSRPENRQMAGKLLIVGGNLHGFAAPAEAYDKAVKSGIGTARVLLPNAIQRVVGKILENGEFAPSTPSGGFSQKALGELLSYGSWADGVLFAGDMGRNSETAILLEKFLQKSPAPAILAKDAADYAITAPQNVLQRDSTLLAISLSQLQRLGIAAKYPKAVTFGMGLLHLAEWLHDFTTLYRPFLIVKHTDQMLVAANGKVSSTKLEKDLPIWRVQTAACASVWWLQNPGKPFEAITTSIIAK